VERREFTPVLVIGSDAFADELPSYPAGLLWLVLKLHEKMVESIKSVSFTGFAEAHVTGSS
jgi:hypothetical protein